MLAITPSRPMVCRPNRMVPVIRAPPWPFRQARAIPSQAATSMRAATTARAATPPRVMWPAPARPAVASGCLAMMAPAAIDADRVDQRVGGPRVHQPDRVAHAARQRSQRRPRRPPAAAGNSPAERGGSRVNPPGCTPAGQAATPLRSPDAWRRRPEHLRGPPRLPSPQLPGLLLQPGLIGADHRGHLPRPERHRRRAGAVVLPGELGGQRRGRRPGGRVLSQAAGATICRSAGGTRSRAASPCTTR